MSDESFLPPEERPHDAPPSPLPPDPEPADGPVDMPPSEPKPAPIVTPVTPVPPQSVRPAEAGPQRHMGALWWGTILVFIGAALLISQFVPGVDAWRYWPVFIIILGVRQLFGPARHGWTVRYLGEGLTTIALGLVLLGQMIGYLQWDVWLNILRLWPLLLVSLGLEVIGKAVRSEFVRFLSSLVIVAGIAFAALVMTTTSGFPIPFVPVQENEPFSLSEPSDSGVRAAEAKIDGGVGDLSVTAGDDLVTAEGETPFDPVFEVEGRGDDTRVRVGLGEGVWVPGEKSRLDVTLDENVEWDLEIDAGVSNYELDLRDFALARLVLNAGVSSGTLTLGTPEGSEAVPVRIDAGVSSLTLRVPREESVRVSVEAGLTGVDTEGDWDSSRDGDDRVYESEGFTDSGSFWNITVNAGISSVTVEYY